METNKIIRSICYFCDTFDKNILRKLSEIERKLAETGYLIQTKRICTPFVDPVVLESNVGNKDILLSVGAMSVSQVMENLHQLNSAESVSFNIELSSDNIDTSHTDILFRIIKSNPQKTFNFAYVFNNKLSSPYFPSGSYEQNGFAIGLQPTDLSDRCMALSEWHKKVKECWIEICKLFKDDSEFLGIDSSIAPIFSEKGSIVNFVKRLGFEFNQSITTDIYLQMTKFIKEQNPKPVGLCGLMMPCLEDFELAEEYEKGNFTIERNIFLSLHSGLGIDTYPIGIDEKPERVAEILKLVQGLSNKYIKPLSVRFVSDGKSKIGEKTDFKNQYLKDVTIRKL